MANTSYQPWYTTQQYPIWQFTLNTDAGSDDISGVPLDSFTLELRSSSATTPTVTPGTGTFSVVTTSPAVVQYAPSAADVANPFVGNIFIKALFGGLETVYDPIAFVITAS